MAELSSEYQSALLIDSCLHESEESISNKLEIYFPTAKYLSEVSLFFTETVTHSNILKGYLSNAFSLLKLNIQGSQQFMLYNSESICQLIDHSKNTLISFQFGVLYAEYFNIPVKIKLEQIEKQINLCIPQMKHLKEFKFESQILGFPIFSDLIDSLIKLENLEVLQLYLTDIEEDSNQEMSETIIDLIHKNMESFRELNIQTYFLSEEIVVQLFQIIKLMPLLQNFQFLFEGLSEEAFDQIGMNLFSLQLLESINLDFSDFQNISLILSRIPTQPNLQNATFIFEANEINLFSISKFINQNPHLRQITLNIVDNLSDSPSFTLVGESILKCMQLNKIDIYFSQWNLFPAINGHEDSEIFKFLNLESLQYLGLSNNESHFSDRSYFYSLCNSLNKMPQLLHLKFDFWSINLSEEDCTLLQNAIIQCHQLQTLWTGECLQMNQRKTWLCKKLPHLVLIFLDSGYSM